jgi:hypothetical protein
MEFEPLEKDTAAATVLGQEIRTADADEMKEAIIARLFEQYAEQHGIVAEQSEIDAWVANLDRAMRKDKTLTATNADDLTAEEAAEIRDMRQNMARAIIYPLEDQLRTPPGIRWQNHFSGSSGLSVLRG